jgi:putative tryptophan/tyrosine transport system substrate-binding protein
MRRREFIAGLGSAASWPLAARAQLTDRVRRIGVLIPGGSDDREYQACLAAFLEGLRQTGWIDGRNVRIDRIAPPRSSAPAPSGALLSPILLRMRAIEG